MTFVTKAKAKDFSFLVKAKAKDFYVVIKETSRPRPRPRTNIPAEKADKARLAATQPLKIGNLGAVRHLGFQGRWISTIAEPSGTSNEPTYQI